MIAWLVLLGQFRSLSHFGLPLEMLIVVWHDTWAAGRSAEQVEKLLMTLMLCEETSIVLLQHDIKHQLFFFFFNQLNICM